jgi:membrane protein DedA with SNARE-associated domain
MFAEYLKPITIWIGAHPEWALVLTFIISFSESLAIIGSVIPGSITMTAIGILAGSGVMRIDFTFVAAILGAIAGDSVSYMLGYVFRHRLVNIWPFSRYPSWLSLGKSYFEKHGGKSVLLGRFIGPLRSIVPVIAGMLHMNKWHFLLANTISAIGWSILYLLPGVLIGAASHNLSSESASRLFVVILILLFIVWLISITLKWVFKHINLLLRINLHKFWLWSKNHPRFTYYLNWLTPINENDHYPTASLIIVWLISLIVSIAITLIVFESSWTETINNPIYLFFQTLRVYGLDIFFIFLNFICNPIALFSLILSITFYSVFFRDWRTLKYWLSLTLTTSIIIFLGSLIDVPEPAHLIRYSIRLSFPAPTLTFATAFFGFLIFYINTRYRHPITSGIKIFLAVYLALVGIGQLYLGDNWLTGILSAYSIGFTIALTHWILYRRITAINPTTSLPIIISFIFLLCTGVTSFALNYQRVLQMHTPVYQNFILSNDLWWSQKKPMLPLYTSNRMGKHISLFNLQYAGSIAQLEKTLVNHGWKKQSPSFFYTLLLRVGGVDKTKLPLINPLFLNKRPSLVMTFKPENKPLLILKFWRSNYFLSNIDQPIWLGSLHFHRLSDKKSRNIPLTNENVIPYLLPSLQSYSNEQIDLTTIEALPEKVSPTLLFIKEQSLESK